MYAILVAMLLGNSFDMVGGQQSSFDMIGCVKPKLVEESDEEAGLSSVDNRVFVYLDLDDIETLARVRKDCDSIQGLRFIKRSSDSIPSAGRDYLAKNRGAKLPLLQYHTAGGWKFRAGWDGGFKFAQLWASGNPGKEVYTENQNVPVGKGQTRSQNQTVGYPVRGGWWTGCDNWTHLTQGPHAGKFDSAWLRTLSNAQIQSLHSDDHEGRVHWEYVNKYKTVASSPKATTRRRASGAYCPSGNCPWLKG